MEYTLKKTIEGDGFIIRVHSPIIGLDERNKRMKEIKRSAENLMKKVTVK